MQTSRTIVVIAVLIAVAVWAQPSILASENYVGVETCKHCHPAQYEAWKNGPHAKAFYALDVDRRSDSKCISCHATRPTMGLDSVQCESCHGQGVHYAKSYIMKDRALAESLGLVVNDQRTCLKCHTGNMPTVTPFSFDKFWKRLPHNQTDAH